MVRALCRVVGSLGCHTRSATSGEEALAFIEARVPDLLFLDLAMPGMTGPDVLERIRPDHPDLPVVIVTGYPDSDLMHRAAQHPPLMLVAKPASPDQIEGTLRAVLGDRIPNR
jgi:CheY-like chemotaxis protein